MTDTVKKARQITENRLSLEASERRRFIVKPEAGTNPDDMLDPAYWVHIARRLTPLDRIEAIAEDGSWLQELIVMYTGQNMVRVARLAIINLEAVSTDDGETYEIKWAGPGDKHRIIRKADGAIMGRGYRTKEEAAAALAALLPKAA